MEESRLDFQATAVLATGFGTARQEQAITITTRLISVKGWSETTKGRGSAAPETTVAGRRSVPTGAATIYGVSGVYCDAALAGARLRFQKRTTETAT